MSHKPGQPRRQHNSEVRLNPESKWDVPKEYAWPKRQKLSNKRILLIVAGAALIVFGAAVELKVI